MGRVKDLLLEREDEAGRTGLTDNLSRGEKYVCEEAVSDIYVKNYIKTNGHPGICSYTGEKTIVIDIVDLAEWVVGKITKYFHNPDDDCLCLESTFFDDDEDDGDSILKKVNGYVTLRDALNFGSTEELLSSFGFSDNGELLGDIDNIVYNTNWINIDSFLPREDQDLSFYWECFARQVKELGTYVPSTIEDFQAMLLGEADKPYDLVLDDIESILVQNKCFTVLPEGTILYRCRNINDRKEIKDDFKDLTSAPADSAVANRMSKAGESMFYAAFKKEVSLQEAVNKDKRLQALGIFKTTKPIVVADLTNLPRPSIWADTNLWGMYFLHEFTKKISENFDSYSKQEKENSYIPTQVFTSYIRRMSLDNLDKGIDGLMYFSSKIPKEKNVVLFIDEVTSREYVEISEVEYSPMPV